MKWLGIDLTDFLNALIVLVTGALVWAGAAIGRRVKKPETPKALALEGAAIVSSKSVIDLGVEMAALRALAGDISRLHLDDNDKTRKIGYKLVEMSERIEREMAELRREITDLAKEVARAK